MNSLGQGSIGIGHRSQIVTPPFAAGADNGLSIDPITSNIVLGDPLGATGPADLLDDREIFFDANILQFSQRNTTGFQDWETIWLNNFFLIRDSVANSKSFGVSVDFAGNTGIYLGNDRTEVGWIPPFLRMDDTNLGSAARLQWTEENAMEFTNDFGTRSWSYFPVSGNVQWGSPARQPDPACNLFIEGNGTDPMAFFFDASGNYFQVDQISGVYQLGDLAAATNGLAFTIDDAAETMILEKMFVEAFLVVDDANDQARLQMQGNGIFIDATVNQVALQENFVNSLLIDGAGGQYVLGDVNSTYNGMRFVIDRTGNYGDLTNDTLDAVYHINGNAGANGSFTAQSGETVTVEGGIIISIV